MLAFFGLSFGLVAAVVDSGFLIVCLVACAISLTLFILAYVARRRQLTEWRVSEKEALASARCKYCGSQNAKGTNKCVSCGAPI
jgi:ABC-type nickel/cobalt efflux system permease component RcnA